MKVEMYLEKSLNLKGRINLMKIFVVDKFNEFAKVIRKLEKIGYDGVERKENLKFRMTKNDYVILDDKQELEGLEKLKNIIMILNDKNLKNVWKMVNDYKTIDIIDSGVSEEYLVNRIDKLLGGNGCEENHI